MSKIQALALGNYASPEWHPFTNADKELPAILAEDASVTCTEDYDAMLPENLQRYQLFISYADRFKSPISPEQTAGVLSFVANGGAMVAIHNGISLQNRSELRHMIGGKFTGHPPYRELTLTVAAPEHEIMQGIEAFTIHDEPYQFEFTPAIDKSILLQYNLDGRTCPAAWAHEYGLGRIVYLMPGHDNHPFRHPVYRKLIRQSCRWAARLS